MKFKYYLRGCGIGILFTTIILMISFHSGKNQMTDSQVMERASELGMITTQEMISATENTQAGETVNTEDLEKSSETVKTQNTESKADTGEKNTEELEVVPDFDTEEKEKETESKYKKNNKKDKASDSKKDQKDEKIVLEVKRGDVCRIIAENLATLGMVEDAEDFRKYMQKNGYDHQINVGTFELKKGMSYEEIAKTITS